MNGTDKRFYEAPGIAQPHSLFNLPHIHFRNKEAEFNEMLPVAA